MTDHRINQTDHGLEAFMAGGRLRPFLDALALDAQERALAEMGGE